MNSQHLIQTQTAILETICFMSIVLTEYQELVVSAKKPNLTIYGPRQSSQGDVGVRTKGHFHLNEATIGTLT